MITDSVQKQQVQDQIDGLQAEIRELRRKVGIYCMTYVRSIVPLELEAGWQDPLKQRVEEAKRQPSQRNLWGDLKTRADARPKTNSDSEI